jgi:(E)-4-hydroxy-3-methylbut-2-enyl-diphosphate synthase
MWRTFSSRKPVILTLPAKTRFVSDVHPLGHYRTLAEMLRTMESDSPIWIRNTTESAIEQEQEEFSDRLLEASILSGSLICDGIGDMVSVETVGQIRQSSALAYNILQGARARTTKTEYVACPSCGRTLFDLQTTTQKIRAATGHLKGVTIAVMGCIVNGPGEMADADFGYVGGAPGKINLYVGKECVKMHIPSHDAVEALIDLIKEHDKWEDASANA